MSNKIQNTFTNIANAIRTKNGETAGMKPEVMAEKILALRDPSNIVVAGGVQGTPVPNSGTLNEVYFNTELSVDEVVNLLDQLTLEKLSPSEDTLYNMILSKHS